MRDPEDETRDEEEASSEEEEASAEAAEVDEERWKGRRTDISELSRRWMHGDASSRELIRKIKDDLGED